MTWVEHGELPYFDPAVDPLDEGKLMYLMEDIYWTEAFDSTQSDMGYILDVGWYPEGDATGAFGCKFIANGNWQHPVEELRTRSLVRVREWLKEMKVATEEYWSVAK